MSDAPTFARGSYEGPLRALLVAYKHGNRVGFAKLLGAQLREPLAAALSLQRGTQDPIIVAAPSRSSRVRARGFRHVEVLVKVALAGGALRGIANGRRGIRLRRALRAKSGRVSQVGLDPVSRQRNASLVAVRRVCRKKIRGREVVFVDDIMTTGATVHACCDALKDAGATVIGIAVLCVAERRDTRQANEGGN